MNIYVVSADDLLEMSGVGSEWVRGLSWALPILLEQGECGTCVCVWVAVMWVITGGGGVGGKGLG